MENLGFENLTLDVENQKKLLWDVEEIPPFDDKGWVSLLKSGGLYHVVGGELSDVFSIQINSKAFTQGKTCEVYGNIDIVDKDGFSYRVYTRARSKAESITLEHNSLCLSPPDGFFVSSDWDSINIYIKDRVDKSVILNTSLKLGKDSPLKVTGSDSNYDNVKSFTVNGVGGSAFVRYSRFAAGVLAYVDMTLTRNDTGITSDIYGTVTARFGNTYGKKFPGILLQKLSNPHMLSPTPGNPIELSREVVAVPAYSFLRVEVDFFDSRTGEQFIDGKADFYTNFRGTECMAIQSKDVCVSLKVYWFHPDEAERPSRDTKISNTNPNDQTLGASMLRRELSHHTYFGTQLVQVFAVIVGHDRTNVVKMCGSVRVADSLSKSHTLFTRDESNPESLLSNLEIVPLIHPSSWYGGPEGLNIVLDLWELEGEFKVKADIGWSLPNLMKTKWYDRRLCSVSQGIHGYTGVFYTMFSNAAQALINVSLKPLDFGQHKVYGSIVARYSNVDYPTEYERTLYQSVLFKKTQENALELTIWDTYSLVESAVAVPLVASLIVEVDLYISSNNYPEENLNKVIGFDIELGAPICSQIEGVNCRVGLSVQWSGVRKKISQ